MNRRSIFVTLIVVIILLVIAAPGVLYDIGAWLADMARLIILSK